MKKGWQFVTLCNWRENLNLFTHCLMNMFIIFRIEIKLAVHPFDVGGYTYDKDILLFKGIFYTYINDYIGM